jgi:hypothetical protein
MVPIMCCPFAISRGSAHVAHCHGSSLGSVAVVRASESSKRPTPSGERPWTEQRAPDRRASDRRASERQASKRQASKRQASKMEASKRLASERRASKRQRLGHDVDSASSVGRWRSPLVRLGDGPAERARGHTRESHEPRARSARACAGHPGRTHAGREAQDVCIRAARSTRCRGAAGRTLAC